MLIANRLMGGSGVEGIEGEWVDKYHQNFQIDYVNMGETYTPTLIHDNVRSVFLVSSWGDFVESHPKRFPETKNNPDDEDEKPDFEGNYTITDRTRGGYSVGLDKTHLGEFDDFDKALLFIAQNMEDGKYWPDVYFINDHGNVDLLALRPKTIKGKVIKVTYKTVKSWV
jgi:hypothetical protein